MKSSALVPVLMAGILISGCASHKPKKSTAIAPVAPPPIITPDNSLTAKVVSYNSAGRFVVLNFPVGRMPAMNQTLFLYRAGLKVAEIKITGPQRDSDIVADVIDGDAQAGDEVRDQ